MIARPSGDSSFEREVIVNCLAGIRRRLFLVRVTERLIVALAWGGAIGACLTGARLLREGAIRFDPTNPGLGWVALLLAMAPLGMAVWAFFRGRELKNNSNAGATLTPALVNAAAGITAVLSLAALVLLFMHAGAQVPVWAVPVAVASPFVIMAVATVRMVDERAAAIFVDQQIGLNERVSTALELLENPAQNQIESAFRQPVIASALAACQQVKSSLQSRTARIGYYRLDQRAYAAAALCAIVAAGTTFFTPLPAMAKTTRRVTTITVEQSKKLEQVMKELEQAKALDKSQQDHLKPLQSTIQQLQQGNMSEAQSSAMLAEAKKQMEKEKEQMDAADKVQEMLRQLDQTKDFAKAADGVKDSEVNKAQGKEAGGGEQKASNAVKNSAEDLANKVKGGSEGDRKNMADQLQKAADQAGGDPQLQKDLQDAANAAQNGDANKLSQSMQSAGQRMGDQSAENQLSDKAMRQAMSQIETLQNQGGMGSQSTMGDGQQGNNGGQNQANNGGGNQNQGQQGGGDQGQGSQPNGGQQANGQQGGGQQQGSGAAAGNGNGSGNQARGEDSGSTNLEQAGGPGEHHGGPIGGKGSFVHVYAERETATNGTTEKVGSKINPLGGPASGTMDVMGPADKNDPMFTTYESELEKASKQATDELNRQEIPPQYQEMVKEFYQEPAKK